MAIDFYPVENVGAQKKEKKDKNSQKVEKVQKEDFVENVIPNVKGEENAYVK